MLWLARVFWLWFGFRIGGFGGFEFGGIWLSVDCEFWLCDLVFYSVYGIGFVVVWVLLFCLWASLSCGLCGTALFVFGVPWIGGLGFVAAVLVCVWV